MKKSLHHVVGAGSLAFILPERKWGYFVTRSLNHDLVTIDDVEAAGRISHLATLQVIDSTVCCF